MANTFILKRSAVQGKVPTTGDLQLGELALNTYDGKLYAKKDNGTASIVRFGGTTDTALTFNNGGSGAASGTTFDGGTARTISYNSIGAPSTTGTNASGTWGISITGSSASCTGNAATVTNGVYQNSYGSFQATFTSNIDANVNRNAGVFGSYSNGATNTPTTAGLLWNATGGASGSGDGAQIWQDYVSNNLYVRQRWGGNWSASWLPILSSSNFNTYAPTLTGTGASGTWGISITGSSTSCTGNAATATDASTLSGTSALTLSASLRANNSISGGGTITVNASAYVKWGNRFIIISNGRGAYFGTSGYFDIACPLSGTITGVGGAADVTATSEGIPLGGWQAIYYILPIGQGHVSLAANFRIAQYTGNVDIPHNWVLICVRNGDDGLFYFPNGVILSQNSVLPATKSQSAVVRGQNGSGSTSLSATENVYEIGQYKSGFWDVNGASWMPSTDFYWGATFAHVNNNSTYNYSGQLAFKINGGGNDLYARTIFNGTPTSWSRLLSSGNFNTYAPTLTGTGASGSWGISITGNAATATTWATPRTITIGDTGKSVDGSGNVSWSLAEIGAVPSSTSGTFADLTSTTGIESLKVGGLTSSYTSAPGATESFAAMPMASEIWHDLFAFLRFYTTTFETFNGSTWSSQTLNKELFAQKENQSIQVIDTTTTTAARWTFTGVAYGSAPWLVIGHAWNSGSASNKTVTVESSADGGSTWFTKHQSTYSTIANAVFHRLTPYYGDNTLRVTIQWNSGGEVRLSNIKLLTSRPGDQGRGKEHQLPFAWTGDQDVTIGRNLSVPGTLNVTGAITGALTGNAATATTWATGRTIALTGDVTGTSGTFNGSANLSFATTLANSGVTAGTYNNSATQNTPLTVDAKGRITGTGTAVTITPAWSSITSKPTTLSGYGITDAAPLASPALTGTPTAPTAALNTNTTQLATTAYVLAAIADDAPTKTGTGASGSWGISVTGSSASCTGNAATATSAATLTTGRTINGTSFNGSANITTANWGTARTITIGDTGKSVDGSGNVSWTLSELGTQKVVNLTVTTASATAAKTTTEAVTFEGGTVYNVLFTLGCSVNTPTINGVNIVLGSTNASTTTLSVSANATIPLRYCSVTDKLCMFGSYRTVDADGQYDLRWENSVTAGEQITRYKIVMEGADGKFYPLTIGDTTAGTKTVSTVEFKIKGKIFVYNTTATIAAEAAFTNIWDSEYFSNPHYTFNVSSGLTNYRATYLVGTINANGNFVLDNSTLTSWLTQTLPTTEDGKVYIYLGFTHNSSTTFRVDLEHPIYEYRGGRLRLYVDQDDGTY